MLAPIAAGVRAQSVQKSPVIGFLSSGAPAAFTHLVAAFRAGLAETGYVEGRNLGIEFRWAEDRAERLPELAADLVRRRVAVIVATGGNRPALAAKAATATIPIVFTGGNDPVRLGLVTSLGRPGGNATGAVNSATVVIQKRLEMLRELAPKAALVAVLYNPGNPEAQIHIREIEEVARAIGQRVHFLTATSEHDFGAVFATIAEWRAYALFVVGDPLFNSHRAQLVALAARHRVPASYPFRDMAFAGGLMSYGANLVDTYRQVGGYTGRILKGAKPGDLPVLQPSKFELVINLKTAAALGLTIPAALLARADEVIE